MEAWFPSASVTPFNIFYGVDLLEVSSFSFWMSKNTFNSGLFLKDIFAGHRLLGWQVFFPFSIWKMLSSHVWRLPRRKQVSLSSLFLARNVAFLIWMLCHWFWVTGDDVLCLQFSLSLENCGQNFFKCCFLSLPLFFPVEKLVFHIWGYMESLIGHWCWSLCVLVFFSLDYFSLGISIWTVSTMNASSSLVPIFSLYCRLLLIKSSVLFISF